MKVTVVGEENIKSYVENMIEDLLDSIVINYKANIDFKILEDGFLVNDRELRTPEYVKEDDEKEAMNEKLGLVTPSEKMSLVTPSEKMGLVTPSEKMGLETPGEKISLDIPDERIDLEIPTNPDLISPIKKGIK